MEKQAKYNIGETVIHTKKGYRAIIIDIDPLFQASGQYNPAAMRKGFNHKKPWYRLLIDESLQMAYVEESSIEIDNTPIPIDNPKVNEYLDQQGDQFICNQTIN